MPSLEQDLTVIASPTSAAELLRAPAWDLPEPVIQDVEAGLAEGQLLVTVEVLDEAQAAEAEGVLRAHDADHVTRAPAPPAPPATSATPTPAAQGRS